MGWRIVDCTSLQGSVEARRGAIEVTTDDETFVRFPVKDLAVVLIGPNTRFSAGTIHRLIAADVAVMFCDWRAIPYGGAYSWSDHTRIGARQAAQINASVPRKKALWADLVRAKIRGQGQVLEWLGRPAYKLLKALVKEVRSGDPSNVEGQAARLYWRAVFGNEDFVRSPGAGFGLNACLDYGYMIVRGFGIRAVLAAGLNPAHGVFHRGRSNPFNLVDDFIEPFRPAIDAVVAKLDPHTTPDNPDTKQILVAAATSTFEDNGSTVATSFEKMAQSAGRYFEGDIKRTKVPRWIGPRDLEILGADDGG